MKEVRLREELANVFTHGIGIPLSIAGLVLLVVAAARDGELVRRFNDVSRQLQDARKELEALDGTTPTP